MNIPTRADVGNSQVRGPRFRLVRAILVLTFWAGTLGCQDGGASEQVSVPEHRITDAQVVISTESGQLGRVVSMVVDQRGRLWMSDAMNHSVHLFDPHSDDHKTIGREGGAPGEFRHPNAVALSPEGVLVYDLTNARIQRFSHDGDFYDSRMVEILNLFPTGLNGAGDLVVPSLGFGGGLAQVLYAGSTQVERRGVAQAPMPQVISMSRVRSQAARGEIPAEFANNVLPVIGSDGSVWLVNQVAGTVDAFNPRGQLTWSAPLPATNVEAARNRFFEIGHDASRMITIPWSARAGQHVDGSLWLLLDDSVSGNTLLEVNGSTGEFLGSHVLSLTSPVGTFAIDPDRRHAFLFLTEEASLAKVQLP
jgi:hypothetical protein